MAINTPVRFKQSGHTSEGSANQAKAVGDGVGIITAMETRDGVPFANVHFAVYGATFTGVPLADLTDLESAPVPDPQPVAAPKKGLFARLLGG